MAGSRRRLYLKLFFSTFQLSVCTFGGGFVILPLMQKKFVEELGWIGEQEMLDLTAIAQSSPGAIAVNASVLVGYHMAGLAGAFFAVLGTVLPLWGIISIVSLFYRALRSNVIVDRMMAGMLCGVAAVILDVVIRALTDIIRHKQYMALGMFVISFVLARFLSVNILVILLACGAIGGILALIEDKRKKEPGTK